MKAVNDCCLMLLKQLREKVQEQQESVVNQAVFLSVTEASPYRLCSLLGSARALSDIASYLSDIIKKQEAPREGNG